MFAQRLTSYREHRAPHAVPSHFKVVKEEVVSTLAVTCGRTEGRYNKATRMQRP